jgi:DNA-binding protein HU-beta
LTSLDCEKLVQIAEKSGFSGHFALEKRRTVVHPLVQPKTRPSRRRMMTQSQVSAHLAEKVGITKKQAKSALEELTGLVVKQLKKEGALRLAGLGIFRKRKTKARVGRNPATGEPINIPARTRLRFTAAKALKDSVLGAK